ncbi:MAG: hypothetical protein UX68_C0043G0008, partial [Parcubacteria group bacterium GW2011_GWA2_46_9]
GDPAKSPDTVANSVNLHTPWISKECKMYLALCSPLSNKLTFGLDTDHRNPLRMNDGSKTLNTLTGFKIRPVDSKNSNSLSPLP